jgi:hypothetical protein
VGGEYGGFKFLTEQSSAKFRKKVVGAFGSFSSVPQAFFRARGGGFAGLHNAANQMRRVAMHRGESAVIIKDPYCLYSAEWLHQVLGWRPWLIIRDPLSYIGTIVSEKEVWDVRAHLSDPRLVDHLDRIGDGCASEAIRRADDGILVAAVYRWVTAAVHYRYLLNSYKTAQGWAFSSLEELNDQAERSFGRALSSLGVAVSREAIARAIPRGECVIPPSLRRLQQTTSTLQPNFTQHLNSRDIEFVATLTRDLYAEIKAELACEAHIPATEISPAPSVS